MPVRRIIGGWGDGRSFFGVGVSNGLSFFAVGEGVGPPLELMVGGLAVLHHIPASQVFRIRTQSRVKEKRRFESERSQSNFGLEGSRILQPIRCEITFFFLVMLGSGAL